MTMLGHTQIMLSVKDDEAIMKLKSTGNIANAANKITVIGAR
ncbi:hypothetical protein N8Z26_04440 [Burkholderiales bacterium]|nr:hypothetical protein [Burkholderiales bacterium]